MKKKKILVITTCFSPENAIGSVRLTKMVKYLYRAGFDITVLSPKLHEASKIDYSMECEELKDVIRVLIPQGGLFNKYLQKRRNKAISRKSASNYLSKESKQGIVNNIKIELFRFIHFFYTIIRNYDWRNQVLKFVNNNFKAHEFDIVLSSYPSLGAHWAAQKIKRRSIAKYWVADFRDPLNYEKTTNRFIYNIYTRIQNSIIYKADLVTTISKGLIKKLNQNDEGKFMLLYNGYDESDFNNTKFLNMTGNNLVLSYVGSLYGGERDIGVIFSALSKLSQEGEIELDKIKIEYAGKDGQILLAQARKYKLESLVEDYGFVSKEKAIEIQAASDLVVVATWNTKKDQGILSGKVFECFLTRKTVVGVVNGTLPNSEFKELIESVNGGIVFEEASSDLYEEFILLKNFLSTKYKEKILKGSIHNNYNNKVNDFSYSSLIKGLELKINKEL